jgi:hypothetical protein
MNIIIYAWIVCFIIGKALLPAFAWEKILGASSKLPEFLNNDTLLSQVLQQLFHTEPVSLALTIAGTMLCLRIPSISKYVSQIFISSTLLAATAAHYLHIPVISSSSFLFGLFAFGLLLRGQSGPKLTTLVTLAAAILLTPHLNILSAAIGSLPSLVIYAVLRRDAIQELHDRLFQTGRIQLPEKSSAKPIFRDCEVIDFERRKAS